MNDNENAAYYNLRAAEEDEAASKAVNPIAAGIHRSLASRYRAKVFVDTTATGVSIAHD